MMETLELSFANKTMTVQIIRSHRRKTVGLQIDSEGIRARVPALLSEAQLKDVLQPKTAWLVRKQRRLELSSQVRTLVSGETFLYLGRQYQLRRSFGKTSVQLNGRFLEVYAESNEEARRGLEAWYRARASEVIPERVALYCKRLGVPLPPVYIREQRKRWGSWSGSGLRFNWRIVMAPLRLVDYVVAHEVCHLSVSNHSEFFWKLLEVLLPDALERRETLANEGIHFTL
jgi:predicted metal-dependent hydrolase